MRTIWRTEQLVRDQPEDGEFEARRGVAQGAAESPLLWLVFYDMVIGGLIRAGVGDSVRLDKWSGGAYRPPHQL